MNWKGLGNVSCTFLRRVCIYGPGCMIELHKEYLHPAGCHTSWHHRVELLGLVGLPGAKKPEEGNTSREEKQWWPRSRDGSKCVKLMRSPWERELERKKQFDVFITGCEITQPFSSLDGRWSWSWKGRMIHSPDSRFSLECRCTLSSESWAHVKWILKLPLGLPQQTRRGTWR